MVGLTEPNDQPARASRERTSRPQRYSRFRRGNRQESRGLVDPTGPHQLGELAQKAVEVMERHTPKSENNHKMVMELLRLQYNMNFLMVCEKCGRVPSEDELIAPER